MPRNTSKNPSAQVVPVVKRSRASSQPAALVAGPLHAQHLKRNIEGGWPKFVVLDAMGDYFNGKFLGVADSLLARLAVGHYAREFQRICDSAAVVFSVDFDGDVHLPIVRRQIPVHRDPVSIFD